MSFIDEVERREGYLRYGPVGPATGVKGKLVEVEPKQIPVRSWVDIQSIGSAITTVPKTKKFETR